jgi:hypothetical protein
MRWVALGAVLGCLLGFTVQQVRAPVYESTSHLIVVGPPNEPARGFTRTAQALARLATAPGIVSFRLDAAGLPEAANDPRRYITVQASPDAPLISVTGRGDTPANAQRTAATVTAGLSSVRTLGPFRVDVVTQPSVPDGPRVPTWFLPFSGTGLGAALSLVLAATVPDRPRRGAHRDRRRVHRVPRPPQRTGRAQWRSDSADPDGSKTPDAAAAPMPGGARLTGPGAHLR